MISLSTNSYSVSPEWCKYDTAVLTHLFSLVTMIGGGAKWGGGMTALFHERKGVFVDRLNGMHVNVCAT
jgi:hypothetical protein